MNITMYRIRISGAGNTSDIFTYPAMAKDTIRRQGAINRASYPNRLIVVQQYGNDDRIWHDYRPLEDF